MARPRKAGLLYFPLDVDIFDADFKITDLMDRYGPKGLAIYLAILCLVYREGYYLEIPFRSLYAQLTKMIGNRWINDKDFVPEVIGFCGELGLFDADLLSQGVITSRAIQRRYKEATKRNKVDISRYWLLDDSGEPGESMPENRVSAAKTGVSVTKTRVFAAKTPQIKGKEMKPNEIKSYEINGKEPDGSDFPTPMDAEQDEYRFYGKFQNIRLTDAEYAALSQEVDNVDDLIEIVSMHMKATGVNYRNHYARLLKWDKEDHARHKKKAESGCSPSYDVEAFAKQGFDLPELEDDDK